MLPPLLADANIAVQVVKFLRDAGVDVTSLYERRELHLDDEAILALATAERRFVLTHDSDFGTLVIARGAAFHGILFLRPGDDPPDAVIASLRVLMSIDCDWSPPLVAVFQGGRLRLRRP